jgi:hypothetical protein
MKKASGISVVFASLVVFLGSSCDSNALKSGGGADSAAGGQSGSPGGAAGSGGIEAGGGALGNGGAAGGGGGGKGGSNTGGKAAGGSGGIVCPPSGPCQYCPNGSVSNPSDPCACPICILPDAAVGNDATTDACLVTPCPFLVCPAGSSVSKPECGCPTCVPGDAGQSDGRICPATCPDARCAYGTIFDSCGCPNCVPPDAAAQDATADACLALPCVYPLCPAGYAVTTHACGCPTCEQVDAGRPDGFVCPPIACPDLACAGGMAPNPSDPCGCPVCARPDASADSGKLACTGLDECSCALANGCGVISEKCYCPYPKCGNDGACFCGGGKFVGCAPVQLTTCVAAKARIAAMCPTLSGRTFDTVCDGADSLCATKCLNDATVCSDVRCSFCDACDCAGDPFGACLAKCKAALTQ